MIVRQAPNVAIIEAEPENKIITITFKPINLDLDAAKILAEALAKVIEESGLDKFGLISDMRDLLHVTRTAREYFAQEGDQGQIIADAVIIKGGVMRELYNLSMKFTKPKYPVQAFTSLMKAREWVEQKVKEVLS